jgi:hypothetical protein
MHLCGLEISSPRRPKKNIIDKTCPNLSDIKAAQKFLVSLLVFETDIMFFKRDLGLKDVVNWLQVNLVSYAEEIDIKSKVEDL